MTGKFLIVNNFKVLLLVKNFKCYITVIKKLKNIKVIK